MNLDGRVSMQHCFSLLSSRTYRMVKSNRINDHEFFQVVFIRRVVPVPGYNIEGGEILPKQRDRGLPYTAFQLAAHMRGITLPQFKNEFSAGERYTGSLEHKVLSAQPDIARTWFSSAFPLGEPQPSLWGLVSKGF